jgi:hypothetical protein
MGYGEIDQKAINTIRVLAVSFPRFTLLCYALLCFALLYFVVVSLELCAAELAFITPPRLPRHFTMRDETRDAQQRDEDSILKRALLLGLIAVALGFAVFH